MNSLNHSAIHINLGILLATDYRVLAELTLDLEGLDKDYRPELACYQHADMNVDWDRDKVKVTTPPLLIAEVLSPRQGSQDVVEKIALALRAGITEAIFVSPQQHTLQVFKEEEIISYMWGKDETFTVQGKAYPLSDVFK